MATGIYEQAFKILEPYFDRSTKRFLDRQIKFHLSKKPEELTYSDKENLAKWIRISSGLMLGKEEATELYKRIMNLRP